MEERLSACEDPPCKCNTPKCLYMYTQCDMYIFLSSIEMSRVHSLGKSVHYLWRTHGQGESLLLGESSREKATEAVGEKLDVITEKSKEPPDVSSHTLFVRHTWSIMQYLCMQEFLTTLCSPHS